MWITCDSLFMPTPRPRHASWYSFFVFFNTIWILQLKCHYGMGSAWARLFCRARKADFPLPHTSNRPKYHFCTIWAILRFSGFGAKTPFEFSNGPEEIHGAPACARGRPRTFYEFHALLQPFFKSSPPGRWKFLFTHLFPPAHAINVQLQNPDCIEKYEKEYHEACRGRGVGMKSESQVIHIWFTPRTPLYTVTNYCMILK